MASLLDRIHTFAIPTPFPVGPVNVHLIEGDPLTLVDTGPRVGSVLEALLAKLSDLGYAPGDIEQIVVTHSHADHIGQAPALVESSNAPVLGHYLELYWLTDFEAEWERQIAFYGSFLRQAGLSDEGLAALARASSMATQLGASIPEDRLRLLHHGDTVEAGGVEWSVLHMPGHGSGHIVLHQPEAGIIIAGDLLLADVSSNPVLEAPPRGGTDRPRSLVQYLNSLQRLAELDASHTLTGHGPPIEDHRGLVAERLAMHQRRLDRIVGFLADSRPGPDEPSPSRADRGAPGRTPYEVCQALFPDLTARDVFLGISEVVGHLDVLEDEGRVVVETHGDCLYYRSSQEIVLT